MGDKSGSRASETGEDEQSETVDNVAMEAIRQALLETTLEIGAMEDANIQSFVKLSQGNDTVQEVLLHLYEDRRRGYETLELLGKGLSNLGALRVLTISFFPMYGLCDEGMKGGNYRDEVAISLYWQTLTAVLGRVRYNIELRLEGEYYEDINYTQFAAAIQGVSTIRTFHSGDLIPWDSANTLMSALASLPSLENVTLAFEERPGAGGFRGLTNLLKSPSLRSIEFSRIQFSNGVTRALLAAFEEGLFVTSLRFTDCCRGYGVDMHDQITTVHAIVQALQRNLSVKTLSFVGNDFHELFCEGITTILLVNKTLVDLTLRSEGKKESGRWLQPLFVAMQINSSLKSLDVDTFHLTDELVCEALRGALANNSVLESLTLHSPKSLDDTSVDSWRKTLPFIRDNTTLKSLTISFNEDALDPHHATLCFDTVAMLEGNSTLECLSISSGGISSDTYFAALESLQPSSTLKILRLSPVLASMGEEGMNQVVSLVKKNYSLTVLDECVCAHDKTGEVGTLLRLNQVGRRYLIKDAASIAKGVEVLIGVSDDLGCLLYHLLENPTLCDIEYQYTTKSGTGVHLNKRQRI